VTIDATHELGGKTRLSSEFELGYGDISAERDMKNPVAVCSWNTGARTACLGVGYGLRYVDTQPGFRFAL